MVLPSHTNHQSDSTSETVDIHDYFDSKYKVIVGKPIGPDYVEMIEWLNKNSNSSVDVKMIDIIKTKSGWQKSLSQNSTAFIAFENSDDALFFKIKYSDSIIE